MVSGRCVPCSDFRELKAIFRNTLQAMMLSIATAGSPRMKRYRIGRVEMAANAAIKVIPIVTLAHPYLH